uniref:Uncharacterized protein n=1 Tax=Helianthus annuus TaxID=4232 RepID=A0A251V5U4_HELAN
MSRVNLLQPINRYEDRCVHNFDIKFLTDHRRPIRRKGRRAMRMKMCHCLLRHHLSPLDRHAAVARNEGPSLVNKRPPFVDSEWPGNGNSSTRS